MMNKKSKRDKLRFFYENQGGGIKEKCEIPEELFQQEVNINPKSEVILIGPDREKRKEKDEYFVPNLHNGLFRIHAHLYENQINSVMINCDIDNMEKAWESISKYKPPFIAFSPYYDTMHNDLKNIEHALTLSPNSVIIIGGFEASLNPQWTSLGGLVDIIVRGEGEFPLQNIVQEYKKFSNKGESKTKKEFLEYLKDNSKIENIPAISILEEGKTIPRKCITERVDGEEYQKINLNAFQKHLELSPIGKYWELSRAMFGGKKDSYFRFVTSDHCPYKCIFCQSSIHHSSLIEKDIAPLRCITPENVINIIQAVSEKYPKMSILIDDDNFLVKRSHAIKTLEMIIEGKREGKIKKDLMFQCRARTDNINPDICKILKEAGFKMISVGAESYSSKELEYMKKRTTPEQNLKAVKIMLENGIEVAEDFLLYTPVVTADTLYENAKGICRDIGEFATDSAVGLFLSPLPSTELWGDGNFEKVENFPYKKFFKDKVMFRNAKNGYEYIGTEIHIPRLNFNIPHPEIVLVKDSLMRNASLESIKYLPQAVEELKTISPGVDMSRSFITLSHLSAISKVLKELTNEPRWSLLGEEIKKAAIGLKDKN
ncbi:radical SAM protein [Candidatus Pacearchaeota archaeon]|nr:radical SAM protein [Candidatus Pacearchaeota archaeon]